MGIAWGSGRGTNSRNIEERRVVRLAVVTDTSTT